jgi:hypothetical protein
MGTPHTFMTYIPSPDTRIKDLYGLGVGISMVCEILRHFLFKGGMGISIVFEIFSN